MVYNVIFAITSLIYLVVLDMIYFTKTRIKSTRSKTYEFLLFSLLLYLTLQTISIFILHSDVSPLIIKLFWRGNLIFLVGFYLSTFLYLYTIVNKINFANKGELFKNKIFTISIVLFVLLLCVILGFPLENVGPDNIVFLDRNIKYIFLGFSIFIILATFINTIVNFKKFNNLERFVSFFTPLLIGISLFLQIKFNFLSILPLGAILIVYLIYFCVENPDIMILSELTSTKDVIDKSNKAKTDFLSNMTYEIKGPMNIIAGISDSLLNLPKFDINSARSDIQQIQSASNNLIDIINNILDISKIESGHEAAQNKEYSLNSLINDLTMVGNKKIGAKPVKLIVNVDNNLPTSVSGDYGKLYQVLLNVLSNSIKFTDVGKITFSISGTKNNENVEILFKINDTGVGIKEEDQQGIFEKFSKNDNVTDNDGSGLGLAITKKYVDLIGGKIWFESQYRVGSTFYISLTQKIVNATPLSEFVKQAKPVTAGEKLDCSAYTALIVDDNLLNIKVAKRLLEGYKFKVDSVTNGQECVYKIKEDAKYDIIFMDHMMPEMDGIETLHVLKKLDGYQLPPIVALTANAIAGMKEMYLNEGFDEYLSKPINTNDLNRIINMFFNKE